LATAFISHLIAGIFLEQTLDAPISKTQKLWKVSENLRILLAEDLQCCLGSVNASKQLVLAVEILYRKFIRNAFADRESAPENWERLKNLSLAIVEKLTAKGTVMFLRSLKTQTVAQTVQVPDPKKKGAYLPHTIKKTVVQRHRIPEGPMTILEETATSNLNTALNGLEGRFIDYSVRSHGNPLDWAGEIEKAVEHFYSLITPLSKTIGNRREAVRNSIMNARIAKDPNAIVFASKAAKPTPISPLEWKNALSVYITTNGTEMERAFNLALNIFSTATKNPLQYLSTASPKEILDVLLDVVDPLLITETKTTLPPQMVARW
jgi:hypothetical protein